MKPGWKTAQAAGDHWGLIAKMALEALGPLPADCNLGFLYVTEALADDLSSIVTFLKETSALSLWVGGVGFSVSGPLGSTTVGDGVKAMVLLAGPVNAAGLRPFILDKADDFPDFLSEHADWIGLQNTVVTALAHADPGQGQLSEMVSWLGDGAGLYVAGGLTVPGDNVRQVAGRVCGGGLSGVLLGGGNLVMIGLSQGCHPIGPPHRVTEAMENVVMGLDSQSALEVMKAEVGDIIARDLQRAQGYIHVALPLEGADDPAAYRVRSLMAVDPRRGWLAVGERVENGDRLMFVRRDAVTAQLDFRRMLDGLARRVAGQRIVAGLYVSCVARQGHLFAHEGRETEMIQNSLGRFPLIGFTAAGEICGSSLYGYTGVLTLFLEGERI